MLRQREIETVIPDRADELGRHDYDRPRDRQRPIIEQTINRLKRFRQIATGYGKLASSSLAMVTIAMMLACR